MGDGLLTIDGDFHRRSRLIMLPGLPPRAHRRLGRRDGRGDQPRARAAHARRAASTCTPGRAGSRCAWRCARCSASTPTASAPARSTPPACSSGPSPSTPPTTSCACCAAPFTPWARMQQAARELDTLIYSEISQRRAHRRARRGHPQPAARRPRRGRHHAHRPADPRRGDDADVRRPRHDHLDGRLHVLRARPPPADRRAPARRAGRASSQDGRPTAAQLMSRRAGRARDGAR